MTANMATGERAISTIAIIIFELIGDAICGLDCSKSFCFISLIFPKISPCYQVD
jgi:hypothetical protein